MLRKRYCCIKRDFPRDLYSSGKREPTLQNCPLTSNYTTHIIVKKAKNKTNLHCPGHLTLMVDVHIFTIYSVIKELLMHIQL